MHQVALREIVGVGDAHDFVGRWVRTGPDGSFRLSSLPAGRAEVWARWQDRSASIAFEASNEGAAYEWNPVVTC